MKYFYKELDGRILALITYSTDKIKNIEGYTSCNKETYEQKEREYKAQNEREEHTI